MRVLPGPYGLLACCTLLVGIAHGIVEAAGSPPGVSDPSDAVSLLQVSRGASRGGTPSAPTDSFEDPFWEEVRAEPSTNFDGIPVFKHNRAHMGSLSPRSQWIVVYPQNYTHDMLMSTCGILQEPAMCDYVSYPETGELAFTTVHAYEREMRTSSMFRMYEPAARYVQVDGSMNMYQYPAAQYPGYPPPGYPPPRYPPPGPQVPPPGIQAPEAQGRVPWGLDRIDQPAGLDGKYHVQWGGYGIHVYHMDTGVNDDQVQLKNRAFRQWDTTAQAPACPRKVSKWCALRPVGQCRYYCARDMQGHGSHTAGTICGLQIGVANGAICHSMKVLNNFGSGAWSWFLEAVNEVTGRGFKPSVVSASLGGPGIEPAVHDVIERALLNQIVVVVAAGNDGADACTATPGYVREAIVVGAVDKRDRVANFSNYGRCVDIFAPGVDIASVDNRGRITLQSGTSMSAPHVAGVAAMVLRHKAKADEVENALQMTGIAFRGDWKLGGNHKLLNIHPKGT